LTRKGEAIAKIYPYMNYENSKEAIEYNEKYFNAKIIERNPFTIEMLQGHKSILEKIESGQLKIEDTTIHAMFNIADATFMASDAFDENSVKAGNVNLLLDFDSEDADQVSQMEEIFQMAATHPETKITMQLEEQFWGGKMGTLIDKYQITWLFHAQPYSKLK
jgi:PhnB protein